VEVLKRRFPKIQGPHKDDICYATTNRQTAVKAIAPRCDAIIVVGSPNSSNSLRLVEDALKAGCPKAMLVPQALEIPWHQFEGVQARGVTAGASAPESLVAGIVDAFRAKFEVEVE